MSNSLSRNISINRAAELKDTIADFWNIKTVPTGYKEWEKLKIGRNIISKFSELQIRWWYDWKWQLRTGFVK